MTNLQLALKSTHLPKWLLMLKGPIWIFFGGLDSLSHGSAVDNHFNAVFPMLLAYGGFPPGCMLCLLRKGAHKHDTRSTVKRWHTNTIQQRDTARDCTKRSRNFWATAGGSSIDSWAEC